MRFYLDPSTASAFRRCFMRPMVQTKFPKSYVPQLRSAWVDSTKPFIDGDFCVNAPKFTRWLSKALVKAGAGHTYLSAFATLANKLSKLEARSAVDRLGDLMRPDQAEDIRDQHLSVRQKLLRQRARKDDDEDEALTTLVEDAQD